MDALRKEIEAEMQTLRINKRHVYGLLMRLVDEIDGGAKPPTPVKKAEPAPAKKVVRKTTKKKVEAAAEPALK